MSAIIQVSGTVREIVELARILEAGLATARERVSPEVQACIDAGHFINAIKVHRLQTGCGLKEAKDFIESIPGVMATIQEGRREAFGG